MNEKDKSVLTGAHFINGDVACAEGAIAAGCRFFAGYPITPATEIAERMAERLPHLGGTYIQMEDEIASVTAILGASWSGVKSMTSTSGPGFSLMMEGIGLGIMTETPCVIVNVQRGGPSTGLPTMVAQGDMMQARWGSHGHYEIIALCPSSPQEMFDLTVKAFNLSELYRLPVLIMADEVVAHMTEKVVIPRPQSLKIINRRKTTVSKDKYMPYAAGARIVPPIAHAGDGYHIHITGLTHNEMGYPQIDMETHQRLVKRLIDKIRVNIDKITIIEEDGMNNAEVIVCAYGISARTSMLPVKLARKKGMRVGMLKLVTPWPFPEQKIRKISRIKGLRRIIVPEINYGQIALEVERCVAGRQKVITLPHGGGGTHNVEEILDAILDN
ncbi:MAG: 2-oxoacid:acceptor oxidoreductase subunit alpha [Planctomycetota bacterium]|nr:2-oxoacid:acceptor oxidoreductase subunit alpha [Planctomycetota bacterium]MDI6786801.1 2-oxoacid:acceptor oxidoreductase subunit alpha [Planctomycetota bacterium]